MDGGAQNDLLRGGDGNDRMYGGDGNDLMTDVGNDRMTDKTATIESMVGLATMLCWLAVPTEF